MGADAHLRTDPRLVNASSGEQGAHVSPVSGCHVLTVHAGRRASCRRVTWNHFLSRPPYRPLRGGQLWHLFPRFLPGWGLSSHHR